MSEANLETIRENKLSSFRVEFILSNYVKCCQKTYVSSHQIFGH